MLTLDLEDTKKVLFITKPTFLLTGSPGTGKSTLSAELVERGYKHLELDKVVEIVAKRFKKTPEETKTLFGDIYRGRANKEILKCFLDIVLQYMDKHSKHPIVIDGALSDPNIIKKLFKSPIVVFLYPNSVNMFAKRLLSRLHDDMKTKNYRMGETAEIIDEYKKNGVSKPIKKYIKDLATLKTKKGQEALELFKDYDVIQVLV